MYLAQLVIFPQLLGMTFLQCLLHCCSLFYAILLEIIFSHGSGPKLTPWNESPALSPLAPPSAATHSKGSLGSALWSSGGMGILL